MASKVFFDLRKTTSSPSNKSSSDLMARDGYRIDYEAMGAHIVALHKAARNHEINICRVLFDPRLQPYLYKVCYGGYLERNMQIPNGGHGYAMTSTIMWTWWWMQNHRGPTNSKNGVWYHIPTWWGIPRTNADQVLIAQDIVEGLEAALEQFREIAADLGRASNKEGLSTAGVIVFALRGSYA